MRLSLVSPDLRLQVCRTDALFAKVGQQIVKFGSHSGHSNEELLANGPRFGRNQRYSFQNVGTAKDLF